MQTTIYIDHKCCTLYNKNQSSSRYDLIEKFLSNSLQLQFPAPPSNRTDSNEKKTKLKKTLLL